MPSQCTRKQRISLLKINLLSIQIQKNFQSANHRNHRQSRNLSQVAGIRRDGRYFDGHYFDVIFLLYFSLESQLVIIVLIDSPVREELDKYRSHTHTQEISAGNETLLYNGRTTRFLIGQRKIISPSRFFTVWVLIQASQFFLVLEYVFSHPKAYIYSKRVIHALLLYFLC